MPTPQPLCKALALLTLLLALSVPRAWTDDLTGLAQDDPKDLAAEPARPPQRPTTSLFLPMPTWAGALLSPALPDVLKPTGKAPKSKAAASATPPPLAPPKDSAMASSVTSNPAPPTDKPASSSADSSNPNLIAVSPFLQWVQSNPKAAAEQARQQADAYHRPTPPDPGSPAQMAPAPGGMADPYWLPPLIDSSDFGPKPVTGSAAIYQTPQR